MKENKLIENEKGGNFVTQTHANTTPVQNENREHPQPAL